MIEDKADVVGVKISVKRSKLRVHILNSENLTLRFKIAWRKLNDFYNNLPEGGCNGYSYTMNYANLADVSSKKDEVVTTNNVTVLVDPKATFYIAGTVMDYEVRLSFYSY